MNDVPYKYAKIVDFIRDEIDAGRLRPGDRIPSLQELAMQFHCAMETARGAITVLTIEGLVERKRGHGTFVTQPEDRRPAMFRQSDSVPESVMMLIMRLAEERDEQAALIIGKLENVERAVAELRLGDDRDHQFGVISRQLDGINQMLAALPRG